MLGRTIAHYRIVEKLGEGGMGVVYKAEDTRLHRPVAIKFLPADLTRDPIAKQRFIQEAQSASALDHPNICTIYEFNETEDGQLYMVMAYYEGEALSKKIDRGALLLSEAVDIAIQIAEGLAKAHARGIVHRDIKAINVMRTRDNLVKILDFGVAKLIGYGEKTGAEGGIDTIALTTGTLSFMSPEQIAGDTVDDRTDIWSLAILLYQMLTGNLPFHGEYEQAVRYSILNEQPKALNTFRKDVPVELEKIIQKGLAKDLMNRYQHVLELLADLKAVRQFLRSGSSVPPDHRGERNEKKRKYIPGIMAIMILLILLYLWIEKPFYDQIDSRSITVLPFKNLSGSGDNEYFSDGITEDILIQISRIKDLKVISFNSSKLYKGSEKSLREIGQELRVRHLLQGTVRRTNEDLRITAQLIDLKTDELLWADTYERKLADIFSIQNQVAERIASALKIKLTSQQKERLDNGYKTNLRAYDYYLKGREYYYRYRPEDNDNAIQLFKRALDLDPNYALAYAGLADAYVQRTLRYGMQPVWLDSAMQQCQRALALDKNSAETYKALGLIYYAHSWFGKALESNRAAIELNPNYDPALGNLGWIYYNLGKFDQSYHWLHQAVQLNPTNPNLNLGLGMVYFALQDYDQAREYLEIAFNLQPLHRPNALIALIMIDLIQGNLQAAAENSTRPVIINHHDGTLSLIAGDAALHSGNPQLAGERYQQALDIEPGIWQPFTGITVTTNLGFLFWKTAHPIEAETMFELSLKMDQETVQQGSEWWGVWYDLSAIHAIRGDSLQAFTNLERAYQLGFNLPAWLQIDPLFENLRGMEKFRQLITTMESTIKTQHRNIQ